MYFPLANRLFGMLLVGALLCPAVSAQATVTDNVTTITLEKAVYFTATDGSVALAEPGEYSVEATQEWLRLTPGTERRDALLVETSKGIHDEEVPEPVALSVPGGEEIPDTHVVTLLLPEGEAIDAVGTYSGIRERGLFSGIYNKYKKKYTKKYRKKYTKKYKKKYRKKIRKNPRLARRILKNPRAFRNNPRFRKELRQSINKEAREAPKIIAKETKKEVNEATTKVWNQTTALACKGAFETGKAIAWAEEQTLGRLRDAIMQHLKTPRAIKQLQQGIDRWLMRQGGAIGAAMDAAKILNQPNNLGLVKDLSNPEKICTQSPHTTMNQIIGRIKSQYQVIKNSSQVRTRGSGPFRMSGVTIGGQFGLAKGGGGELGIGGGIGFDGSSSGYGFTGAWAGLDAGASFSVQIGIWGTTGKRSKELVNDLSGPYIGMGYTGNGLLKMQFAQLIKIIEKFGLFLGIDVFWNPSDLLVALNNQGGIEPIGVVISVGASKGALKSILKELPSISAQGGYTFLF